MAPLPFELSILECHLDFLKIYKANYKEDFRKMQGKSQEKLNYFFGKQKEEIKNPPRRAVGKIEDFLIISFHVINHLLDSFACIDGFEFNIRIISDKYSKNLVCKGLSYFIDSLKIQDNMNKSIYSG